MTRKEYETSINMLMAQGRELYCMKLMKEASKLTIGLFKCKEHMDEVFVKFRERLMVFDMDDYPEIYTKTFKQQMRNFKFNIQTLYFFNTDGQLVVTYR